MIYVYIYVSSLVHLTLYICSTESQDILFEVLDKINF